jgi:hypothetical protein
MSYTAVYRSADGYRKAASFRTLAGLRAFVDRWAGLSMVDPEGARRAVSADGIGVVTWEGASPAQVLGIDAPPDGRGRRTGLRRPAMRRRRQRRGNLLRRADASRIPRPCARRRLRRRHTVLTTQPPAGGATWRITMTRTDAQNLASNGYQPVEVLRALTAADWEYPDAEWIVAQIFGLCAEAIDEVADQY